METTGKWINLLDNRIDELNKEISETYPDSISQYFTRAGMNGPQETMSGLVGIGDIPLFDGNMTELEFGQDYERMITPLQRAGKLSFERAVMDDMKAKKNFDFMVNGSRQLLEAMYRTQSKDGIDVWTSAFSAALTFMWSEEGLSMCNSAHTSKNSYISTTSGWGNAGTTALSKAAVAATRVLMGMFRMPNGQISIIPNDLCLVVPLNLADKADEIVRTALQVDSANNNINPLKAGNSTAFRGLEVIVDNQLDLNDTNNWFMVSKSRMKQNQQWRDRVKPELKMNYDFNTLSSEVGVYARYGWIWKDWRHVYGHNVG